MGPETLNQVSRVTQPVSYGHRPGPGALLLQQPVGHLEEGAFPYLKKNKKHPIIKTAIVYENVNH